MAHHPFDERRCIQTEQEKTLPTVWKEVVMDEPTKWEPMRIGPPAESPDEGEKSPEQTEQ